MIIGSMHIRGVLILAFAGLCVVTFLAQGLDLETDCDLWAKGDTENRQGRS